MKEINILMIDDNEDDYLLVSQYLKRSLYYKYKITYEFKKDRALEIMNSENGKYDLFLIDYMLGSFTGLELITEARNSGFKGTVLLFTGNDDTFIHEKAMKIGVREFLNKNEITPVLLERTLRYVYVNKKNEDILKKTLIEKDLLLKEIINRETENLEFIQDLLTKSLTEIKDEKIKDLLRQIMSKIVSVTKHYSK